jgi:5-methylcytosine-specific restriction endonuclease McrA
MPLRSRRFLQCWWATSTEFVAMFAAFNTLSPEQQEEIRALIRAWKRERTEADAQHSLSVSVAEPVTHAPGILQVPEVVPVLPEAQAAFLQLLSTVSMPAGHRAHWWLSAAMRAWSHQCAYCGRLLSVDDSQRGNHAGQPTVDHLVPIACGGPDHHEAVVLCCFRCNANKGQKDWIEWGKAKDKVRIHAMRRKCGGESFNHLAPDPSVTKTKHKMVAMLDARWVHPRFRVHASVTRGGAFLAVKDRRLAQPEFSWIARHHGGKEINASEARQQGTALVFSFERPRDALCTMWTLIERNALIRRLDLCPAFPDATPGEDEARSNWAFTSPNVADLVRRRFSTRICRTHSQAWKEGILIKVRTSS